MEGRERHEVWERQEGESAKNYERFEIYLELGPGRTLERAFHAIQEKLHSPKLTAGSLRVYAARHKWVHRADQFDAFVQKQAGKSVKERVKREAIIEGKLIRIQIRVAHILAKRLLKFVETHPDYKLSPGKLTYVSESLTKLSRLMRGDSTERTEVISTEERDDLERRIERLTRDPRFRAEPRDEAGADAEGEAKRVARKTKP